MDPNRILRDATVQELQLELIRRTKFNTFDGELVCELLAKYRGHWLAVLFDQLGVPNYDHPGRVPTGGLIKLRDLADNIWNVDSLFILTHTPEQARELCIVFEESGNGAMPYVIDDIEEADLALGMGRRVYGLLKVWWD